MRATAFLLVIATVVLGCSRSDSVSPAMRTQITAEIEQQVRAAYDLSTPNAEQRLLSLYPDTGRIVSASLGHLVMSRDTLFGGIRYFWRAIGVNMRDPHWVWDQMVIDVLSPDAAVMTASYHIPHFTPRNLPHTIGGAMTAVFRRQGTKWVIIQEHLSDTPPVPMDTTKMKMSKQ